MAKPGAWRDEHPGLPLAEGEGARDGLGVRQRVRGWPAVAGTPRPAGADSSGETSSYVWRSTTGCLLVPPRQPCDRPRTGRWAPWSRSPRLAGHADTRHPHRARTNTGCWASAGTPPWAPPIITTESPIWTSACITVPSGRVRQRIVCPAKPCCRNAISWATPDTTRKGVTL